MNDAPTKVEAIGTPPKERIAVLKAVPIPWYKGIGAKITAVVTGNALVQLIIAQIEFIQALEVPKPIWWTIGAMVALGSITWIGVQVRDNLRQSSADDELDKLLVETNSTPDNKAQLIPAYQVDLYRAKGFKIITRGEALPPQQAVPGNVK